MSSFLLLKNPSSPIWAAAVYCPGRTRWVILCERYTFPSCPPSWRGSELTRERAMLWVHKSPRWHLAKFLRVPKSGVLCWSSLMGSEEYVLSLSDLPTSASATSTQTSTISDRSVCLCELVACLRPLPWKIPFPRLAPYQLLNLCAVLNEMLTWKV